MIPLNEHKKATLHFMLGTWQAVCFWCDSRQPNVIVPEGFRKPQLRLRIGNELSPRVEPLIIDDTGITAGLLFSSVSFRVFVPWDAIYLAVPDGDDRAMVWGPSVPEDVRLDPEPEEEAPPKKPNHLKLVP